MLRNILTPCGWSDCTGWLSVGADAVPESCRLGQEDGSLFARMPTHAMRPHEWGTRFCGATQMWATLPVGVVLDRLGSVKNLIGGIQMDRAVPGCARLFFIIRRCHAIVHGDDEIE